MSYRGNRLIVSRGTGYLLVRTASKSQATAGQVAGETTGFGVERSAPYFIAKLLYGPTMGGCPRKLFGSVVNIGDVGIGADSFERRVARFPPVVHARKLISATRAGRSRVTSGRFLPVSTAAAGRIIFSMALQRSRRSRPEAVQLRQRR